MSATVKPCALCGAFPYFDDLAPYAVRCSNEKCKNGKHYVATHQYLDELVDIWNTMQAKKELYALCIIIPHELPSLNEIIDADRCNRIVGAKLKRDAMQLVSLYLPKTPIKTPVVASFHFCYKNRRKDPDNIAAGATKIILDAMQKRGILANDGQKEITELHYTFAVDAKNPHIVITMKPTESTNV